MARTLNSNGQPYIIERVLGKCWDYLDSNFHKFDKDTQVKICLELCKKNMPTNVNMESKSEVTHKVETVDIEERVAQLRDSLTSSIN